MKIIRIVRTEAYNAWRVGDTKLDWYFAQEGQGTHNGASAMGTPGVWTTNDPSHDGYQELNTYVKLSTLYDILKISVVYLCLKSIRLDRQFVSNDNLFSFQTIVVALDNMGHLYSRTFILKIL